MEPLAALLEKSMQKALLTNGFEKFDHAASRKLELCPAESLGIFGCAHQEPRAEKIADQRHEGTDASGGNRNVVDPIRDSAAGRLLCHARRLYAPWSDVRRFGSAKTRCHCQSDAAR